MADNQLQRHIFRASVGDIITVDGKATAPGVAGDGTEQVTYVSIALSGEGFLYHMCRKIAGLTFAVAAGLVPESAIETALKQHSETDGYVVPTAPGELLYLAECNYAKYEQKHKASLWHAEECKTEMQDFKNKIRQHVVALDDASNIFRDWADTDLKKWCAAWRDGDEAALKPATCETDNSPQED